MEGYTEAIPGKFVDVESEEEVGVCSNMLAITGGQRAGIGGQKDKYAQSRTSLALAVQYIQWCNLSCSSSSLLL